MEESLKGSKILKVTGIIMAVFGAYVLSLGVMMTKGAEFFRMLGREAPEGSEAVAFIVSVGGAFVIISAIIQIIIGVLGFRWSARYDKAPALFKIGLVLVILQVLSLLSNFKINNIIALILSGFYMYGAYLNKQGARRSKSGFD